jgi:hypothetical protein
MAMERKLTERERTMLHIIMALGALMIVAALAAAYLLARARCA